MTYDPIDIKHLLDWPERTYYACDCARCSDVPVLSVSLIANEIFYLCEGHAKELGERLVEIAKIEARERELEKHPWRT